MHPEIEFDVWYHLLLTFLRLEKKVDDEVDATEAQLIYQGGLSPEEAADWIHKGMILR